MNLTKNQWQILENLSLQKQQQCEFADVKALFDLKLIEAQPTSGDWVVVTWKISLTKKGKNALAQELKAQNEPKIPNGWYRLKRGTIKRGGDKFNFGGKWFDVEFIFGKVRANGFVIRKIANVFEGLKFDGKIPVGWRKLKSNEYHQKGDYFVGTSTLTGFNGLYRLVLNITRVGSTHVCIRRLDKPSLGISKGVKTARKSI